LDVGQGQVTRLIASHHDQLPKFVMRAFTQAQYRKRGDGSRSDHIKYWSNIRAGKVRALAVTTATRSEALPDIPTVGDFVPGFEASAQFGLGAPKNTPVEVIEKLNHEINAGLTDPRMKARLADLAGAVLAGSPADFRKLIVDETEKWGKVVKFSGARPD
jgi:tripartite-type tricarboxylate transporter receptor subunit TctC